MPFTGALSAWFLLRFLGLIALAVAILFARSLLRQTRVRRRAREMLAGTRVVTEEELDACIREIREAPGRAQDMELLRQLAAEREELRRLQARLSEREVR
jgi:hypothetical protein